MEYGIFFCVKWRNIEYIFFKLKGDGIKKFDIIFFLNIYKIVEEKEI